MKRYKLDELKIGMKVYVDELHGIEGVYIVLGNPKSVITADGNRVEGIIKKIYCFILSLFNCYYFCSNNLICNRW